MTIDHILCGWRVRSALPLPELLPWQGVDRPVDVEISLGPIPACTDTPIFVLPHSKLWADGSFLLDLEDVGRFRVENGRRVVVEPAAGAAESDLRAFLLGSVLGVLCHQRGLLPIHASAVRINDRAILIAGNSGAGKSTLAAALGARGHALAADDVTAFDPAVGLILPAFPVRKLTTDVIQELALQHEGLEANRPGQPKFRVPTRDNFAPTPLPPLAVYVLSVRGAAMQPGKIDRSHPAKAMGQLNSMIYRRAVGMRIQPQPTLFRSLARLAQLAPVHHLHRLEGQSLRTLNQMAAEVEAHAFSVLAK
ncbi:MAG TPA: hypothetical protein VFF03_09030 [Rhodocyclaceae bacterium]|nr:hypothetical protein [Rhodocyclaceae bacterium]